MSTRNDDFKKFCETYVTNSKNNNVNSLLCIYQISDVLSELAFYVYNGEIAFYKKLMLFEDNEKISKYFNKKYKLKNENLLKAFNIFLPWVEFSKKFKDNIITILPEDLENLFALFLPQHVTQFVD